MLEHEQRQPHRLKDLAVDGNDLIELGFPPGPGLGHALRDLLHVVVDDPERNTKDSLLEHARKLRR
jgi:tRNA nucleotidyltransferase (CCA-adding enzyme)